jgi:hypothetical protein
MGQLSANPGGGELTPELAEKLRTVEKKFERIQKSAGERSKWFWLGAIPRLMQVVCVLSIAWTVIVGGLEIVRRMNVTLTHETPGWIVGMQLVFNLVGAGVLLLVATWAHRYCEARSEGRISERVL